MYLFVENFKEIIINKKPVLAHKLAINKNPILYSSNFIKFHNDWMKIAKLVLTRGSFASLGGAREARFFFMGKFFFCRYGQLILVVQASKQSF